MRAKGNSLMLNYMHNISKNYCTLYLVRHGETEWNVNRIIMGHKDSSLTEKGLSQAIAMGQELKNIKFDAIFSSDSLRAFRTAEIIKLERNLVIQTSELLRERFYGHFEGKSVVEYEEMTAQLRKQLQQLPEEMKWGFKFYDNFESDQELINRFIIKLREIAVSSPNKTILLVTHGGCIRNFLLKTGYATREELPPGGFRNAGYVKLLSDGIDFIIQEVKGIKSRENF